MAAIEILTNNPMVQQRYSAQSTFLQDATVAEVFLAARDRIHLGAHLINHPLSGSIKPNESPYKSLVLTAPPHSGFFEESLLLIEGAQAVLEKLGRKVRAYPPQVLEDFQVIDLDLLLSATRALPAPYHL